MRASFFLIFVIFLASCSYIPTRDKEHLAARSIPPLQIPPGISSTKFHNLYPIAERSYPANVQPVNIVPPGLYDKQ